MPNKYCPITINCSNQSKAHGHDNISIRMIKICDKALLELYVLIKSRTFQSESTLYSCLNVKKLFAPNMRDL